MCSWRVGQRVQHTGKGFSTVHASHRGQRGTIQAVSPLGYEGPQWKGTELVIKVTWCDATHRDDWQQLYFARFFRPASCPRSERPC